MQSVNRKVAWSEVPDKDIPVKRVVTDTTERSRSGKIYFYIPSTERLGVVNKLGKNCLAAYSLVTTAQAIHPSDAWHLLPGPQLRDTGLDRYKVYAAMKKLETANIVEMVRRPGHKTLYRLTSEVLGHAN